MTEVNLPSNLEIINNGAFSLDSSLQSITIPSTVTTIRGGAFGQCTNLTSVIFEDPTGWRGFDGKEFASPEAAAQYLKQGAELIKQQ